MTDEGTNLLQVKVEVTFDKEENLWYADCVDLQGCHTFGETKEEALDKIIEVIGDRIYAGLEHLKERFGKKSATATKWSKKASTEVLEIAAC